MKCVLWPAEKTAEMHRLAGEGLSASKIAAALGVTKNAIIGKMDRDGSTLVRKPGGVLPKEMRPPRPERMVVPMAAPVVVAASPAPVSLPAAPVVEPVPIAAVAPPVAEPIARIDPFEMFANGGLTIVDLKAQSCRFPSGDPKEGMRYCGAVTHSEKEPYCKHHRSISWIGKTKVKPDRRFMLGYGPRNSN